MITEIFWQTLWRNKWRYVFDIVKNSSFYSLFVDERLFQIHDFAQMLTWEKVYNNIVIIANCGNYVY